MNYSSKWQKREAGFIIWTPCGDIEVIGTDTSKWSVRVFGETVTDRNGLIKTFEPETEAKAAALDVATQKLRETLYQLSRMA